MATLRKKQVMVGMLADAINKKYDYVAEHGEKAANESEEVLRRYVECEFDVYKKAKMLQEVCDVSDEELKKLVEVIIGKYIDNMNDEVGA